MILFKKKSKNINLFEQFLKQYIPSENLIKPDKEILNFGKKVLPEEIINFWKEYGFGEYGNGIIKIIDPREYMNSLYTWLGGEDFNKIPFMVTAFGDIFYYRKLSNKEYDISFLNIHYRSIDVCTYSFKDFFNGFLLDENIKKEVLKENLYKEVVKKLGNINYDEIFFFNPALSIGGLEDIKYVEKGKAIVHHKVLLELGTK